MRRDGERHINRRLHIASMRRSANPSAVYMHAYSHNLLASTNRRNLHAAPISVDLRLLPPHSIPACLAAFVTNPVCSPFCQLCVCFRIIFRQLRGSLHWHSPTRRVPLSLCDINH
ncbi:uncharacterized protein BDCG_17537 [Blastomyces dermatitidis ER-3]|uniref:Uncharacterized protein n=1 Tax=Ajellomyces dermatitidis (strain ER-3 / ATCC MYA-2586) TaxID=559297 RepID=A0ABX2VZ50_AJEDR|nr:uncharacterized protein BDCG_17537 [Blastomyces dermatitidis ER-3]OAT02415.1 hypothetical protein BDCG_17537 [Blastomyces dermatitidis ER-3]